MGYPDKDGHKRKSFDDLYVSPINNATYIALVSTASGANQARFYAPNGLLMQGDTPFVNVKYNKIRFDPETMLVNTRDGLYIQSDGSTSMDGGDIRAGYVTSGLAYGRYIKETGRLFFGMLILNGFVLKKGDKLY